MIELYILKYNYTRTLVCIKSKRSREKGIYRSFIYYSFMPPINKPDKQTHFNLMKCTHSLIPVVFEFYCV